MRFLFRVFLKNEIIVDEVIVDGGCKESLKRRRIRECVFRMR